MPSSLDAIRQDLKFALRSLVRSPGFAIVAVLTLGLGIGANTTLFTLVNGVLLRPLPLPRADRLVTLWEVGERGGYMSISWPNFIDWRDQARTFAGIAATTGGGSETVLGGSRPARVPVEGISRGYFDVLGVSPAHGRTFNDIEDRPGGPPAVLVSRRFWQRYLDGGDIEGRTIDVRGERAAVVGVMPVTPGISQDVDVWYPLERRTDLGSRTGNMLRGVARLADGVTIEQARAEMKTITARIRERYGEGSAAVDARVTPLLEEMVGPIQRPLLLLLGAAALVLLVACTNVASTVLARGASRGTEIAVRTALGAGRGRIVRQLFTENFVLAGLGAIAGLAFAVITLRALVAIGPATLPRLADVRIDGAVIAFAALAAAITAVLFGLLPAFRTTGGDVASELRQGTRGNTDETRSPVWRVLVGSEVALTVVLLVASTLLIRSFWSLLDVDAGFDPTGVLTAEVALPETSYEPRSADVGEFHRRFLAAALDVPGVSAVFTEESDQPNPSSYRVVSGGYFDAMGIQLVRGRTFDERDAPGSPHTAVINRALARRAFGDADPLGRRLRIVGIDSWGDEWMTVVGVVADVRHQSLTAAPRPELYVHYLQRPDRAQQVVAVFRSASDDPLGLVPAIRNRLSSIDRNVVVDFATMDDRVARSVADRRFTMIVLGAFALAALLLAAIGIYGMMSWTVARRTREIGIRIALGADPREVRSMIVRYAMSIALAGLAAGAVAALITTRIMRNLLFEVSPADPIAFGLVAALLLATAWLATILPAHRSTRIDPMVSMRAE